MVTLPVLIMQQRGSFGLQMTEMKRTEKVTLWICLLRNVSLSTLGAVLFLLLLFIISLSLFLLVLQLISVAADLLLWVRFCLTRPLLDFKLQKSRTRTWKLAWKEKWWACEPSPHRVKVQGWWNRFFHITQLEHSLFERDSRRCVEAFLQAVMKTVATSN